MNREKKFKYLLAIYAALITFFIYIPSLKNEFVNWDDGYYIFKNPYIHSLNFIFFKWAFFSFYLSNWHPLTWVTHAIDYALWGLIPVGHHLINNILHGLNTFLVVLLIEQLLDSSRKIQTSEGNFKGVFSDNGILVAAGVTGLLFGLHPIHVESVAWVSERKDVLCALFFLISIITYIKYVNILDNELNQTKLVSRVFNKQYLFTFGFFFLALLSKPMAVTLPVVLLILDWYPFRRFKKGRPSYVLMEKLPFLLLALGSAFITIQAQFLGESVRSYTEVPLSPRMLIGLNALTGYLSKMIYPVNLSPFYPYPQNINMVTLLSYRYLVPLLLVIGITIICVIFLKRQKLWSAAWAYYIVTILPVLGIIQVGNQAMADRYTYLPSIGPFFLIGLSAAWFTDRWLTNGRLVTVKKLLSLFIAVLLFGALSYATIRQTRVWGNDETLWSKVISIYPGNLLAYYNRGVYCRDSKQYEKAIYDFIRVIKLKPDFAEAHINLGMTYGLQGELDKAIEHLEIAIKIKPDYPEPHYNLGLVYLKKGSLDAAIRHFNTALKLNPYYAEAQNNLGVALLNNKLFDTAIKHFEKALNIKPDYPEAYNNLGFAYDLQGNIDEAIANYTKALQLNPGYAKAHLNLSNAYRRKGMLSKAEDHLRISRLLTVD